ncbi:hypothetical protein K523DRAFT_21335 [Schizophyllum commune Tattone D]|nr:hypothetical protein K523DRAFT_21335 [Schizophyllum commune Tattone D]
MARRSAPPNSGPAYIGRIPAAGGPADDGNAFTNFIREEGCGEGRRTDNAQITSPEKIAGNLSILTGVTVFLAGIFAVRTWGENMIPV